jgi:hypothetical protein
MDAAACGITTSGNALHLNPPHITNGKNELHLLPIDIEPDANMAGVVGDVVKSAKAGSTVEHFVTPKKDDELTQEHVVLKAVGVSAEQITPGNSNQIVEWEGGEEVPGEPLKRRVKRDAHGLTEVKIKAKQGGAVASQMDVWVVWVEIKPKDKPNAPTWWQSVDTMPDGTQLLAPVAFAAWKFEGIVHPASMVSNAANAEIPDLKGAPKTDTPEVGKQHTFDGSTFIRPENKWDMSRQIRVKVRAPNIGSGEFDSTWPNLFSGLPSASIMKESYPTNTLYGNDDSGGQPNEYTNPYNNSGKLGDYDRPLIHGPNHDRPATGSTYEMRWQFREFSRLEINGKWYRVSDWFLWRLHMKATKKPGITVDPDNDPTTPNSQQGTGFDNDGSATDETNGNW